MVTVKEYRERFNCVIDVVAPSGMEFKIKNVNIREIIFDGDIPIQSAKDFTASQEKKDITLEKMSSKDKQLIRKYTDNIMSKGIVEPKIQEVGDENSLSLSELKDDDYYFLLNEINKLSDKSKDFKFFRKGQHSTTD